MGLPANKGQRLWRHVYGRQVVLFVATMRWQLLLLLLLLFLLCFLTILFLASSL